VPSPGPKRRLSQQYAILDLHETSLGLLCGFLLLRQELSPVAEQRVEARLRYQVGPGLELLLALDLFDELLPALLELLVVLRLVLAFSFLTAGRIFGGSPARRS